MTTVFKIESRLLDGQTDILTLTIFDVHPDLGGRAIDGGFYPSVGSAIRDCGFVRIWQGSEMETAPVYMFGTESGSWAETAVRNYPEEFYQHRPPDAWSKFLRYRLPPCDNPECPVGCPDNHCADDSEV